MVLDALPPTAEALSQSVAAFERGCRLKNDTCCLHVAQAKACGRGIPIDLTAARDETAKLCARGLDDACDQWLVLGPTDGGVPDLGAGLERAVIRNASANVDAARQLFAQLDGGDRQQFFLAALDVAEDRLDDAEARAAALPANAPPEVLVLKQALVARRAGQPWPEALWVGWREAGRPDLRNAQWLPAQRMVVDRHQCLISAPPHIETVDEFLVAVATERASSHPLDAMPPEYGKAALRFVDHEEPVVRLVALLMLARISKHEVDGPLLELELAARKKLSATEPQSLFFALLQLPSNLEHRSATEADVSRLEAALALSFRSPRRLVFDRVTKALEGTKQSEEAAFQLTVAVASELIDTTNLPGWLERGSIDAERRAALLNGLATHLLAEDWLLDRFIAHRLQREADSAMGLPLSGSKVEALQAETSALYWGPSGLRALGNWPMQTLTLSQCIEHEVAEVERLRRLAGVKP